MTQDAVASDGTIYSNRHMLCVDDLVNDSLQAPTP